LCGDRSLRSVFAQSSLTYPGQAKDVVILKPTIIGRTDTTFHCNGQDLVDLIAKDRGSIVAASYKTGEDIATMYADETTSR